MTALVVDLIENEDPRFPFTGCHEYVVVFGLRQYCQHGPDHIGMHY